MRKKRISAGVMATLGLAAGFGAASTVALTRRSSSQGGRSGKSPRRLNDHPSTKADPNFLPFVEGEAVMQRKPGQPPQFVKRCGRATPRARRTGVRGERLG